MVILLKIPICCSARPRHLDTSFSVITQLTFLEHLIGRREYRAVEWVWAGSRMNHFLLFLKSTFVIIGRNFYNNYLFTFIYYQLKILENVIVLCRFVLFSVRERRLKLIHHHWSKRVEKPQHAMTDSKKSSCKI